MDDIKQHLVSIPFDNIDCRSSGLDVLEQAMKEIEQQLQVLDIQRWAKVKLRDLNTQLHPHKALHKDLALKAYLYWLHKKSVPWAFVNESTMRDWAERLRSYGFDYPIIYRAFKNWWSVQARLDPASNALYEVIDTTSIGPFMKKEKQADKTHPGRRNSWKELDHLETQLTIELSSGEDSDVEFLGCAPSSLGKEDRDMPGEKSAGVATKEKAIELGPGRAVLLGTRATDDGKRNSKSKSGKGEYICKRCHRPGHHLTDCPTNLDPSYDTKPGDQYKCAICGAVEEHYGTLCPKNTAPWSLNQLRLRYGVRAGDEQREVVGHGGLHSASTKGRAVMRKRPKDAVDGSSPLDDGRSASSGHEVDYIHESRLALVQHSQSRQQSTENGRTITQLGEDHYSSPSTKRMRKYREGLESDGECTDDGAPGHDHKEGQNKRQRHDRKDRLPTPEKPRNADRSYSPELLPVVRHGNKSNGRLSYWDDGFSSPHHKNKGQHVNESRSNPRRDSNNIDWEHEMAIFDVDEFLSSMDGHLMAYEMAQSRRKTHSETAEIHGSCDDLPGSSMKESGRIVQVFEEIVDPRLDRSLDHGHATSDGSEGVSRGGTSSPEASRHANACN